MNLDKVLSNGNPANAFVLNPADNTYTPVNLVSTVLTKCLNCNLYYPISEIEQHLKTHSRSPSTPSRGYYDLDSPSEITSVRLSCIENIRLDQIVHSNVLKMPEVKTDIKTMNPDEIPAVDAVRKAVEIPKPAYNTESTCLNQNSFLSNLLPDMMAQWDEEIPPIVPNQNLCQDDYYFQNLSLHQNVIQLQQKQISKYSFSCFTNRQRDSHVQSRKVPNYSTTAHTPSTPKYTVTTNIQPPKRFSKVITVSDYNKLPNPSQQTSHIESCCNRLCYHQQQQTQKCQETPVVVVAGACPDPRNCVCPGCGGFYCPVCKSTVPPQYRLPPGYKIVKEDTDIKDDITRKGTQSQF